MNAKLRGHECLPRVQRTVELLRKASAAPIILATVNCLNKDHLRDFVAAFDNMVQFQPLYRMGAAGNNTRLILSGDEYFDALFTAGVIKSLSQYHRNIHGFRGKPCKRCAMAAQELSIGPNGDIYPCHMLHYSGLKLGNLADGDSIAGVYHSKSTRALRELSVDILTQCRDCPVRNFCAGACRARLDYPFPGLDGTDPFCVFERRLVLDALLYSYG